MVKNNRVIQRNKDGKIIYDSKIVDEMIQKVAGNVEIINAKIVTNDAFWAIADDMRTRKEEGEFDTYMDAYRWAEENISKKGVTITAKKLESAFHKARSEGKI